MAKQHASRRPLIPRRSLFCGAACTGLAGIVNAQGRTNSRKNPIVALGGLPGFDKLTDPASLARLRGNSRFKLYIHNSAWLRLSDAQRRSVIANSGAAGVSPDIELGGWPDPKHWFDHEWKRDYASFRFQPRRGHVNINKWNTWGDYTTIARENGFISLAPVVTPNHGQYVRGMLSSAPYWSLFREACRLGGGVTADIPVDFYFHQPEAYRTFIADEIIWAKTSNLWTTAILSPGAASRDTFMNLLMRQVADLAARGAYPDEYVVENYNTMSKPGIAELADGDLPNTLNHAALWLLVNT